MSGNDDFLLSCVECDKAFFTKGENDFYKKKGLHLPKRYKKCREKKKLQYKEEQEEKELEEVLSNLQFKLIQKSEIELSSPSKILFIVGNGFDIMHGVESSYCNFRDSMRRGNELRVTLEMYIKKEDLWADFEESLAHIDEEAMLITGNDWMNTFDVKEQHDDDFSAADFFMAAEATVAPTYVIMDKLPVYFRRWLETLRSNSSSNLLEDIIQTESKFINFNYTEFLEVLYGIPKKNIFYIHGERRDKKMELILGHSGLENNEQNHDADNYRSNHLKLKNQTTYDLFETAGYQLGNYHYSTTKKSKDIIEANKNMFISLSEIESIVVIGHSLSVVDYPYFKQIIKSNRNEKNMKWYISWYNVRDLQQVNVFAAAIGIKLEQIKVFKV